MSDEEFQKLALELAGRFAGRPVVWFFAVRPRGEEPQSAANLELVDQVRFLRGLADSLEGNEAFETMRIDAPIDAPIDGQGGAA